MGIAKRDEGSKVNSNINVTPMVDVMLVLLIIFMVVTPMLQKGASVDMAKADNPIAMQDADKEDAVIVAVQRDGAIYLGNDRITMDQITNKVKDKLERKADKKVYVRADAHAKYGVVVDVVDNVRSAGVDQLGLLTEQNKSTTPPPPPSDATKKKTEPTT
ncbi:MAG TPA: biopolymer transporter ExbD [Terriglobales bacterium]|jgi:biopolymer transport protein TolR|nr:biopolymer transporter ExbD [Terriglobales bacterium]